MAPLFSRREIRGLILFLPLAGVLALVVWLARPTSTPGVAEHLTEQMPSPERFVVPSDEQPDTITLFHFDPNTIDYRGLRRLGLSKREAGSLLKYRAAGKMFRIPEDVATCYGFSDSLYFRLEPYIRIGCKYALTPRNYRSERIVRTLTTPEPFLVDTVSALYLRQIGALSKRQAEAFVRWRDLRGVRDMEELRDCYVVSDSVADALAPYVIFAPRRNPLDDKVELNRADSAALRSVSGIGAKSVTAILRYRERLGGFVSVEQLSEIPEVTERNYERILKQIYCDNCEIRKIDINFAPPNVLARHPYLPPRIVRRLLKHRQLKGGWTTVGELVEQNILTHEEAARLTPYLRFGVRHSPND